MVFRHRDDVNCSLRVDRNDLYTSFHVQRWYTSMSERRHAMHAPMKINRRRCGSELRNIRWRHGKNNSICLALFKTAVRFAITTPQS